ncbi:hypothetical protein [Frigidibacter sp.]|uniref:hypothetical protein n=1 Tax=Frigidibacter sp. TaxID=2586418 RepID=UPI0027359936|nr:hypothetical protein [Frigidibacter sp.]MDP3342381.1 hypothetical protein [Frigidibacter sp.]
MKLSDLPSRNTISRMPSRRSFIVGASASCFIIGAAKAQASPSEIPDGALVLSAKSRLAELTYTMAGVYPGLSVFASGNHYIVLHRASADGDIDYTGQGGIKLGIMPGAGGVWSLSAWPVSGDGVSDDTRYIQAAISRVMRSGGGELRVSSGTYVYSKIVINRRMMADNNWDLGLKITGDGAVILQQRGNFKGPASIWIHGNLGRGSLSEIFARGVTLSNLYIRGDTKSHVDGVRLQRMSSVLFDRVLVEGFRGKALHLLDTYDSNFNSMEILRCGRAISDRNHEYALVLSGSYDQTNANKFVGLRVEHCALMLNASGGSRHNYFLGCKFEQSRENVTSRSVLNLDMVTETAFLACQFVQNHLSSARFLRVSDITSPYWEKYGTQKIVSFSQCSFVCSSDKYSYWLDVSCVTFSDCTFSSSGGADRAAFLLGRDVTMTDCKIVMVTEQANCIHVVGDRLSIINLKVRHFVAPLSGVFISIPEASKRSDINVDGVEFSGHEPANYYLMDETYLPDVRIRGARGEVRYTTQPELLMGPEVIVYSGEGAESWTDIMFGFDGYSVEIMTESAPLTLIHGVKIATRSGSDLVIEPRQVVALRCVDGIWYEL